MAATALGAALRFWGLDHQSLWFDEAFSLLLAQHDPAAVVARTARDTMPPLYYWLLHAWVSVVPGEPVTAARSLSALAGTLSIPLAHLITGRLLGLGARAAGWAALVTALAPFLVFYGQEARMYALLGLWNLLAIAGALWGWRSGRRAAWAVFAAGLGLSLYTHALGWLPPLAGLVGVVLAARDRRLLLQPAALALFAAAAVYLPWALVLVNQTRRVFEGFWAAPPTPLSLLASPYLLFMGPFAGPALFLPALAVVLAALAFTLPAVRRGTDAAPLRLLWAWLALPLAALFAVSLLRSLYLERVVIGAAFPVIILGAWTAARLPLRPLGNSLGVALVVAGAVGTANWLGNPSLAKPPLREAVATATQMGGPVLHTSDGSYLPFLVYAPGLVNGLLAGDPEEAANTARARSTYDTLGAVSLPLAVAAGGAARFTLVVLLDHSQEHQRALVAEADARYRRVATHDIGGVMVLDYAGR